MGRSKKKDGFWVVSWKVLRDMVGREGKKKTGKVRMRVFF